MIIRTIPGELGPAFIAGNKGTADAACFRRQFWTREGIGDAIDVCRGAFCHMPPHRSFVAIRAGLSGENDIHRVLQRRIACRHHCQRSFHAGAVCLGDGYCCLAVSIRDAVILRRRGGQFRIADVYRRGIVDHVLAVNRIITGDDKRRIADDVAGAVVGGNGQRDAFPRFDFCCLERLVHVAGAHGKRFTHGGSYVNRHFLFG